MLVYLAGPIDRVPAAEATNWRHEASSMLSVHGVGTFSPAEAFHVTRDLASRVGQINRFVIDHADAVLCRLTPEAFGTIREIEYARLRETPVVLFSDYDDKVRQSFESWDLHTFESLNDACAKVAKLMETVF